MRRAGARPLVGRPRRARSVPRGRGGRGPRAAWPPTCSRAAARLRAGAALRARRALRRPPRRAARRAGARAGRGRARPVVTTAPTTTRRVATGLGPIATSFADLPAIPPERRRARQRAARQPAVPRRRARPPTAGRRCGSASTATRFVEDARARPSDELAVEADARRRRSRRADRRAASRCPRGVAAWLDESRACVLRRGVLVVVDYVGDRGGAASSGGEHGGCAPTAATSAARRRSSHPGEQDITADVPVEYLVHAAEPRRASRSSST